MMPPSRFRSLVVPVAAASGVLALLAVVAVKSFAPPSVVPTRVSIDGGADREDVVATILADYQPGSAWHGVEIEGGTCEASTVCEGAPCRVLRAAVLRPRALAEDRISIQAVITEVWPVRARRALRSPLELSCTARARVDVFKTGWTMQRELRWSTASAVGAAKVSVVPQEVKPKVEHSALTADGVYLLVAELSPESPLASFLSAVPVAVRTEFGYAEQQEAAMHGRLVADAELAVAPSEEDPSKVVAMLPFKVSTSASLPSLAKFAATAAGRSAPSTEADIEHAIVFAAAPSAPATARIFGDSHAVSWSRNIAFNEYPERRLAGVLGTPVNSLSVVQRLRVDETEVVEVQLLVKGSSPSVLELKMKMADFTGASLGSATFGEVASVSISSDKFLEPVFRAGDGSGAFQTETDMGNFSVSLQGAKDSIVWEQPGEGVLRFSRNGEDFSFFLNTSDHGKHHDGPHDEYYHSGDGYHHDGYQKDGYHYYGDQTDGYHTDVYQQNGSQNDSYYHHGYDMNGTEYHEGPHHDGPKNTVITLDVKAGVLTGSVVEDGAQVAVATGTFKKVEGTETRVLDAMVEVVNMSAALKVSAELKPAAHTGGQVVGSVSWSNGTAMAGFDAKLEATASNDLSAHLILRNDTQGVPPVHLKLDLKTGERSWELAASADGEGRRQFSLDAGCARPANSDDLKAHVLLKGRDSDPPIMDTKLDLVRDPVFGGSLKATGASKGQPAFDASLVAKEGKDLRSVDFAFSRNFHGFDGLQLDFWEGGMHVGSHWVPGPHALSVGDKIDELLWDRSCMVLATCDPATETATVKLSPDCSHDCKDCWTSVDLRSAGPPPRHDEEGHHGEGGDHYSGEYYGGEHGEHYGGDHYGSYPNGTYYGSGEHYGGEHYGHYPNDTSYHYPNDTYYGNDSYYQKPGYRRLSGNQSYTDYDKAYYGNYSHNGSGNYSGGHYGGAPPEGCRPLPWAQHICFTAKFACKKGVESSGIKAQFSKPGVVDVVANLEVIEQGQPVGKGELKGKALDHVFAWKEVDNRRELTVKNPGEWSAKLSSRGEKGEMEGPFDLSAKLAEAAGVVTLDLTAPESTTMKLTVDSSPAGAVDLRLVANTQKEGQVLTVGGRMTHASDLATGTLAVDAGDFKHSLDLSVSRGLLKTPAGTYTLNVSAGSVVDDEGSKLELRGAYVEVNAGWQLEGVGWGLALLDKGGMEHAQQEVGLDWLPGTTTAPPAAKVTGSMQVEVQGDVQAFVSDPSVKRGFQSAIATTVGVPASDVKVYLTASRRLSSQSAPGRRLAGVTVDYEIVVKDAAAVQSISTSMAAETPASLTTKVSTAVADENGGTSPYAMTVLQVSEPKAEITSTEDASTTVEETVSGAPWAAAPGVLSTALLCAAGGVAQLH